MKDKITLKEFFESKEKLAIHCDTKEKANKLLIEFDKLGKKWFTGISYLECNKFDRYMDKTCYSNSGEYSDIEFYKDEKYKIHSFEDIIFEEDKPKNLIPEIAKMLGVEIGERFKVDNITGIFYFDNKYLNLEDTDCDDPYIKSKAVLEELLNGHCKITEKLPNKPQLTEAERVILENLPKEYKWIARDRDYCLYLYKTKPTKNDYMYEARESYCNIHMFNHLFQFIQWDDDNTYKIEELLKGGKE